MLVGLVCAVLSFSGVLAYLLIRQFVLPRRWRRVYSWDGYLMAIGMLLLAVFSTLIFLLGVATSALIGLLCWLIFVVIFFVSFVKIARYFALSRK